MKKNLQKALILCFCVFCTIGIKGQNVTDMTVSDYVALVRSSLPIDMGIGQMVKCEYADKTVTFYVENVDEELFAGIGIGAKERLAINASFKNVIYPILKKKTQVFVTTTKA